MPPILAHGALGAYDELIFLAVAAIFLIMMGISWFISRRNAAKDELAPPIAPPTEQSESLHTLHADSTNTPDRFRLE